MRARACGGLWEPRRKKDSSQIRVHGSHSGGPSTGHSCLQQSPSLYIWLRPQAPGGRRARGVIGGQLAAAPARTLKAFFLGQQASRCLPGRHAEYARVVGRGRQSDGRMLVVRSSGFRREAFEKASIDGAPREWVDCQDPPVTCPHGRRPLCTATHSARLVSHRRFSRRARLPPSSDGPDL